MASKAHPGFEKAAESIAKKGGYSVKRARAILAGATRKAVKKGAGKKNPNLLKVKGKAK